MQIHVAMLIQDAGKTRYANRSMERIEKLLRAHTETEWSIRSFDIKADTTTVAQLIEDPLAVLAKLTPLKEERVRINGAGQIRAAAPQASSSNGVHS